MGRWHPVKDFCYVLSSAELVSTYDLEESSSNKTMGTGVGNT